MTAELFSEAAKEVLETLGDGDLVEALEASYLQTTGYAEPEVEYGDPDKLTEEIRAQKNLDLFKQGLCHRAVNLLRSQVSLIEIHAVHGLALVSRGHVEATAQLGYFCDRLRSLQEGNITFDNFHKKLADTLVCASHEFFTESPRPLNILTCIEKADKHFALLAGKDNEGILKDVYGWLSDYCHPNFLSSKTAYKLDKSTGTMHISHGSELSEEDLSLVGYLEISSSIFNMFFDDLLKREGCLAE